jgi:type IV pilus assembly protein PilV
MMNVTLNKHGLTLVEVMVSLVILLFISLALMQVALVSIDANTTNVLRDEAVSIAEQRMIDLRSMPFDSLTPDGTVTQAAVTRDFRVFSTDFTPVRTITTAPTGDVKQLNVVINWTWKGQPYTHSISSIVRAQ